MTDQYNTGEEIEGVVFEDNQQASPEVVFTPVVEEKRKNLAEFYSPLFHKRFSRTQIYWAVFLSIGIFWVGKILFTVHTFVQEVNDYQTSMIEDRPQYENRERKIPTAHVTSEATSSKNKK